MTVKAPRALRDASLSGYRQTPVHAGIGLIAIACLTGAGRSAAQPLSPSMLPEITVDAPVRSARPALRRPDTTAPEPAAVPVPTVGEATEPTSRASEVAATGPAESHAVPAANANPRANPAAPYEIVRSASPKMIGPVSEQPRSLTIVPKEAIEDKAATSVRELVRTPPGLTLGSGEGGNAFGDRVFIRGFDARNDMFIDGVRQAGVTTRENFMAEQIEILAGPAGSVAGRGVAGGAVNVVTKRPTATDFTQLELTGGLDATKRLTVDINRNVSNTFAIRANILAQDADVSNRDKIYDRRYGGSFAADWKPTDTLKFTFDYFFVYFDQMPDWGVPFDARTRRPFTESGVSRNNFYGIASRDFQRNYQHLATAGVEWAANADLTISSKLRYSYTLTDYIASKPGTPNLADPSPALWTVPSTPTSRFQIGRTLSNQTDATYKFETLGLKHTLVAGVELSREEVSQDTYNNLNIECFPNCVSGGSTGAILSLYAPDGGAFGSVGSPTLAGRSSVTTVDTASIYVLDSINWDDRAILNTGVRLDNYHIERAPPGAATLSRSDLLFNWNVGLTYKIVPTVAVYAAFATSSNPIGDELDATADAYGGLAANNAVFRPEQNTSIEIGTKIELFDKRLLATAAVFQTDKEHARETIGTNLQDSASYRIRGLQLNVAGNIGDRWSVFGGAVFLDSAMTASAIAGNAGLPLANIAHESFNLLAKYKLTDRLTVGGQVTYKGEILGGTLQAIKYVAGTVNVGGTNVATPGGYNKLPGGWRFDLISNYRATEQVSVRFQILNVTNERLYDAFYRSATPFVYIAPGRTAYVALSAKF